MAARGSRRRRSWWIASSDANIRRSDRLREKVQEAIAEGTVLIDSAGAKPGQLNGLSVMQLGGFSFGRPSRIIV